jgi:hypothetical protein
MNNNPESSVSKSEKFNVWECIRELPDKKVIAALPASMAELVGQIPLPLILDLIEFFGGLRMEIPDEATEESEVSRILGIEKMAVLCKACQGELLVIPNGRNLKRAARNHKATQLRKIGWYVKDIARHMEVTERAVNLMLAAERQAA